MSQRIQVQPRPDPPDRGHHRQNPWWLNLHLSASGKTLLNADKHTLNRDGWKNSCLTLAEDAEQEPACGDQVAERGEGKAGQHSVSQGPGHAVL